MGAPVQMQAAQSESSRGELRYSRGISRMRGKRGVLHRQVLDIAEVSASVTLLCERNEHVTMVPNVLLSQENGISHATVTTGEGVGDGTVGSTLEKRREECSMLSQSIETETRRVREENALLVGAANEYSVRMKNLKVKVEKSALNGMALLRVLKRSN